MGENNMSDGIPGGTPDSRDAWIARPVEGIAPNDSTPRPDEKWVVAPPKQLNEEPLNSVITEGDKPTAPTGINYGPGPSGPAVESMSTAGNGSSEAGNPSRMQGPDGVMEVGDPNAINEFGGSRNPDGSVDYGNRVIGPSGLDRHRASRAEASLPDTTATDSSSSTGINPDGSVDYGNRVIGPSAADINTSNNLPENAPAGETPPPEPVSTEVTPQPEASEQADEASETHAFVSERSKSREEVLTAFEEAITLFDQATDLLPDQINARARVKELKAATLDQDHDYRYNALPADNEGELPKQRESIPVEAVIVFLDREIASLDQLSATVTLNEEQTVKHARLREIKQTLLDSSVSYYDRSIGKHNKDTSLKARVHDAKFKQERQVIKDEGILSDENDITNEASRRLLERREILIPTKKHGNETPINTVTTNPDGEVDAQPEAEEPVDIPEVPVGSPLQSEPLAEVAAETEVPVPIGEPKDNNAVIDYGTPSPTWDRMQMVTRSSEPATTTPNSEPVINPPVEAVPATAAPNSESVINPPDSAEPATTANPEPIISATEVPTTEPEAAVVTDYSPTDQEPILNAPQDNMEVTTDSGIIIPPGANRPGKEPFEPVPQNKDRTTQIEIPLDEQIATIETQLRLKEIQWNDEIKRPIPNLDKYKTLEAELTDLKKQHDQLLIRKADPVLQIENELRRVEAEFDALHHAQGGLDLDKIKAKEAELKTLETERKRLLEERKNINAPESIQTPTSVENTLEATPPLAIPEVPPPTPEPAVPPPAIVDTMEASNIPKPEKIIGEGFVAVNRDADIVKNARESVDRHARDEYRRRGIFGKVSLWLTEGAAKSRWQADAERALAESGNPRASLSFARNAATVVDATRNQGESADAAKAKIQAIREGEVTATIGDTAELTKGGPMHTWVIENIVKPLVKDGKINNPANPAETNEQAVQRLLGEFVTTNQNDPDIARIFGTEANQSEFYRSGDIARLFATDVLDITAQIRESIVVHNSAMEQLDKAFAEMPVKIANPHWGENTQEAAVTRSGGLGITRTLVNRGGISAWGLTPSSPTSVTMVASVATAFALPATKFGMKAATNLPILGGLLGAGYNAGRRNYDLQVDRATQQREIERGAVDRQTDKVHEGTIRSVLAHPRRTLRHPRETMATYLQGSALNRRAELAQFDYDTVSHTDLHQSIQEALTEYSTNQNEESRDTLLSAWADTRARLDFGDANKVGLITHSSPQVIEQENLQIIQDLAQMRLALKDSNVDFETALNTRLEYFGQNQSEQDSAFASYRRLKAAKTGIVSAAIAIAVPQIAQEGIAAAARSLGQNITQTTLEGVVGWTPPVPTVETSIKLTSQLQQVLNTGGTVKLMDNLDFNFDSSTKTGALLAQGKELAKGIRVTDNGQLSFNGELPQELSDQLKQAGITVNSTPIVNISAPQEVVTTQAKEVAVLGKEGAWSENSIKNIHRTFNPASNPDSQRFYNGVHIGKDGTKSLVLNASRLIDPHDQAIIKSGKGVFLITIPGHGSGYIEIPETGRLLLNPKDSTHFVLGKGGKPIMTVGDFAKNFVGDLSPYPAGGLGTEYHQLRDLIKIANGDRDGTVTLGRLQGDEFHQIAAIHGDGAVPRNITENVVTKTTIPGEITKTTDTNITLPPDQVTPAPLDEYNAMQIPFAPTRRHTLGDVPNQNQTEEVQAIQNSDKITFPSSQNEAFANIPDVIYTQSQREEAARYYMESYAQNHVPQIVELFTQGLTQIQVIDKVVALGLYENADQALPHVVAVREVVGIPSNDVWATEINTSQATHQAHLFDGATEIESAKQATESNQIIDSLSSITPILEKLKAQNPDNASPLILGKDIVLTKEEADAIRKSLDEIIMGSEDSAEFQSLEAVLQQFQLSGKNPTPSDLVEDNQITEPKIVSENGQNSIHLPTKSLKLVNAYFNYQAVYDMLEDKNLIHPASALTQHIEATASEFAAYIQAPAPTVASSPLSTPSTPPQQQINQTTNTGEQLQNVFEGMRGWGEGLSIGYSKGMWENYVQPGKENAEIVAEEPMARFTIEAARRLKISSEADMLALYRRANELFVKGVKPEQLFEALSSK